MITPKRSETEVLIVGAGPTGLTAANVLARNGVAFRVVDGKAGPTEESRALWVHPRTVEYWDKLGLAERALDGGQKMTGVNILVEGTPSGSKLSFGGAGEGRTPYPFGLVFEQSKSEGLLLEGLEEAGGRVEWGTELLSLTQTDEGARAVVRLEDGAEEEILAGWVVGADGSHSAVRHSLGLKLEGETYERGFFLADVAMDWPLGHEELYLNLTREGFMAFFPMQGERRFRLIGSLTEGISAKHERGEKLDLGDVREALASHGVEASVTASRWVTAYRIHQRMAQRFRVGRAFLVGDAAHVHSPAGGQGMNTGIGDAYNLAWKLAAVVRSEAHPRLLDSYEAERLPVAKNVLGLADKLFSLEVTTNPLLKRFRTVLMPRIAGLTTRSRFVGGLFFGLISQIRVGYRGSPAVAGDARGGPVRPGDRAPYGLLADGTSFYEKLRGTGHHVFLFEGLAPDASLGASRRELEGLLERYETPVEVHAIGTENRSLHERYGAKGPSVFLIRPDGHVAYAGNDLAGLKGYLDRLFVGRAARKPSGPRRVRLAG